MSEKNQSQTPAFGIAIVILFILFIIILNQLPFPSDYGFWSLVGITAATCFVGFGIYSISIGIVETIYKIIVEIAGAILVFINVVYGAICWALFEQIKLLVEEQQILISWNQTFVSIALIILFLLTFNIFSVWILYPMAQVAGTRLDPE